MNLSDSIDKVPLIGPAYQIRLNRLGVNTVKDLLYHVPTRYIDYSKPGDLSPGEIITTEATVISSRNQYTRTNKKIQMIDLALSDGRKILAVWFNQPFLINSFREGEKFSLSGKVNWFGRRLALISPEYERAGENIQTGRLLPVYPETKGISSKWLRRRIAETIKKVEIKDPLNQYIREKYSLEKLSNAIHEVHFPSSQEDVLRGKTRLAFDELLDLHIRSIEKGNIWKKKTSYQISNTDASTFINSLPFKLNLDQKKAIEDISNDLRKPYPMNRLLEGDVGSGKTVVAAAATFTVFANGGQTVFLAPTQILAQQHASTLKSLFKSHGVRISLITGAGETSPVGRPDITIGTHALLNRPQKLRGTALIIIDEQHKFGVEQQSRLAKISSFRKKFPHTLTLTATPIPRTVAQTFYGNISVSRLKELPGKRQKITTWIVPPQKRDNAYQWIEKKIRQTKSQAFVICPLIEESEKETLKEVRAVKKEFENIRSLFPNVNVSLMHGRLKPNEKEIVMGSFRDKKTDILVSTPVVEVGIDIPNATIIIIEAADRFGLAQLHQLRGRVGRGSKKSYCLLFTDSQNEKVSKRLEALQSIRSGFELSELDLKLRGPGELFGLRQAGIPELKIASWQDIKLIKKSKSLAEELTKR